MKSVEKMPDTLFHIYATDDGEEEPFRLPPEKARGIIINLWPREGISPTKLGKIVLARFGDWIRDLRIGVSFYAGC